MKKWKDWELSVGFYPGVLIGFRTYPTTKNSNVESHVLYLPLVDLCLTIER